MFAEFAETDFAEFLLWLIDDLPPAEQHVWWSWLKVYSCYLTCCRRDLRERFSRN